MFDRTSETGWFEYSVSDAPDEVLDHLRNRSDVAAFERDGNDATFLSENSSLAQDIYDEDGNDGFEDYGVMSSTPVRQPSDLPVNLRDHVAVEEFVEDPTLASYLRELGIGSDDPREYTLNGEFSLRLDAWRDRDYEPPTASLEPVSIDTVRDADADGLVMDNTGTDYPTVEQMTAWEDALTTAFESASLYAIGSVRGDQFMFDGVVASVDVTDEVREWFEDHFGDDATFSRASELQFYDGEWVRLWWD